jgi:hypothetical protein
VSDPAWFTAKVDQRVALATEAARYMRTPNEAIIMVPLTEPPPGFSQLDYDRWDRSCDGCGAYCPHPIAFFNGHRTVTNAKGLLVHLVFGLCETCKAEFD